MIGTRWWICMLWLYDINLTCWVLLLEFIINSIYMCILMCPKESFPVSIFSFFNFTQVRRKLILNHIIDQDLNILWFNLPREWSLLFCILIASNFREIYSLVSRVQVCKTCSPHMIFPLMHSIFLHILWPEHIIITRLAHEHINIIPLKYYISNSAAGTRIPLFKP